MTCLVGSPHSSSNNDTHLLRPPSLPLRTHTQFFHKLFLWAALVFFGRGSALQMAVALLLTTIRLVLHAHFELHKTNLNNLFDYITLTNAALTGFAGVLLQALQTKKGNMLGMCATCRMNRSGRRRSPTNE